MKLSGKFKIISGILPVLFACIHLWNSATSLSIQKRTAIFGWNQNFGFYGSEEDNRGFSFRWAKKSAGISIENLGPALVLPIVASHPDIAKNPVRVKVFFSDPYFRKRGLIEELVLEENRWIEFELSIAQPADDMIYLIFETNRVWQPLKSLGVADPRWLTIGLGEPWFKYPRNIPAERIKSRQEISAEGWEGAQKNRLWSNGVARIRFITDEPLIALRLNTKARTALGIGPYIVMRIDEKLTGKTMLNEDGWNSSVLATELDKGEHVLSVEFTNDLYKPSKGLDRSLNLGSLEIIYLK